MLVSTVEPPNNGHVGDEHFVHCSEAVALSEVEMSTLSTVIYLLYYSCVPNEAYVYNIHTDLKCIFYADLLYCRQPFFQKHLVLKTNYSELYNTYTYNIHIL